MQEKQYDIDELLVKKLLKETTPEEDLIVEKWLSEDPANKKYFQDFKQIWDRSKLLAPHLDVNEPAAWERFQTRIHPAQNNFPDTRRLWIRVAAVLVLFLGLGALGYIFLFNKNESVNVESLATVVNKELPDGSIVVLNKNSSIEFPETFNGDKRKVQLQGEAFFNVKADKEKPFVIDVAGVEIEVVGTSFNVKSLHGNTEVIVESGIVRVEKNGRSVELRANEKIILKQNDTAMQKEAVNDKLHNYYRSREFVCENTPLWKLVEVLNDAYGVNIVIMNPELRSLPLTTTFNNESLDQVLAVIEQTFSIKINRSGDRIELR